MKKLWFRRKYYGYGWFPYSIEGWIVTFFACALIIFFATNLSYIRPTWCNALASNQVGNISNLQPGSATVGFYLYSY